MPTYKNSKSQKSSKSQSKSQSKNGGRRRKRTMRKLRRGRKSRKVMRGGRDQNLKPSEPMSNHFDINQVKDFLQSNQMQIPEAPIAFEGQVTSYNISVDGDEEKMQEFMSRARISNKWPSNRYYA